MTGQTFWELQQAIFDLFEVVEEDGQFSASVYPPKLSICRHRVSNGQTTYNGVRECWDNGCRTPCAAPAESRH
jgi:hypothetical protein